MLWGRYASRAGEARYPQLWQGRVFGVCPSVQGPAGLNAYDLSGRGRHTTLSGMDAPTDWVRSTGQFALDMDGVNDQIVIPSPAGIPANAMSFATWLRTTQDSAFMLFSVTAPATGKFGTIWLGNAVTGTLSNEIVTVETSMGASTIRGYTNASRTFFDGSWRHVAVVFNGTATVIYVDGIRRTTTLGGGQTDNGKLWDTTLTATKCRIGSVDYGSGDSFFARMVWDDAAIWQRPLTDGEARLLATRRGIAYEARRDVLGGSSGFQAYWARRQNQIIGGGV